MEADGGGVPREAPGEEGESDQQNRPEPDPLGHPARRSRDDGHHQRSRRDGEARPQDRVVPDAGEEEDVPEELSLIHI